ncbi:hypothetical protein KAURM247S_08244 [Kitasatospora aureofaciens]
MVAAVLDLHRHRADLGALLPQSGEEVRVDQELLLDAEGLFHGPAHRCEVGVGRPVQLDGGGQRAQQAQVADVADEQGATGGEQPRQLPDDVREVVGGREVLHHRVDDDGVELADREPVGVVRRAGLQHHALGQVPLPGHLGGQGVDRGGGEVGRPVRLALRRDLREQQAGADADLQHPAGAQGQDAVDGGVAPLPHLLDGDRVAVVTAVPAHEVTAEGGFPGGDGQGVVDVPPLADVVGFEAVVPGDVLARDDVADQPVVLGEDGGPDDGGVLGERRLDLTGLDPEAAHLHLVVGAADVLQLAVGAEADHVAGAVHPGARGVERAGDEASGGQARPVQVAAGQARARDVQLTGHAGRHRPQPLVQHVHPGVDDRPADRRHARAGRERVAHGRAHRGLGGTVGVDHPAPGRPAGHQLRRARLPRHDQLRHRHRALRQGCDDGRRHGHVGDREVRVRQRGDRIPGRGQHQGRAAQQGGVDLRHRGVEARRGELEHPAVGIDREPLDLPGHQARHTAVGDHDALGAAGGARGVDHIGRVPDVERDLRIGVRPVSFAHRRRVVDHQRRTGVRQHEVDPRPRIRRVHRQVRRPGLQHAQDGHHGFHRPRKRHRDQLLRPHAPGDQRMREPVRPRVQLAVRQFHIATDEGNRVRRRRHLPLEGLRHRDGAHLAGGRVALFQQPVPLLGVEEVDAADRLLRVGGDGLQQERPTPDHGLDRRAVEQVGGVLRRADDPGRAAVRAKLLDQAQPEVELGGSGGHRVGGDLQARQREPAHRGVLHGQDGLEERVVGQRPGRVQHLHQVLERHVLMRVRRQRRLPHPAQQLHEARITARVRPQHQRVHEEPDQFVQRLVGPARDRRTDRNVRPGTQPGVQRRQRRLQHHEQTGAGAPRQLGQGGVQLGAEFQADVVTVPAGDGRARPVGGQLEQLGKIGQLPLPVVELLGEPALRVGGVAEQVALPERVVGVLYRQVRPAGRASLAPGGVRLGEVAGQRAGGPPVTGDVVHHQQQHVLVRRDREKLRPQRRLRR